MAAPTAQSTERDPSIISYFMNRDVTPFYASGFLGLISAVAFGALGLPLVGVALAGASCITIIAGMMKGDDIFITLPVCVAACGALSVMARALVFAVRG